MTQWQGVHVIAMRAVVRAAADDVARAAVTTSARVDGERVGRCTARARERRGRSAARGAREVETRGGGERWRRRLRDARAFESAVTRGRRRDARWRREEARERVSSARRARSPDERSSRGVDGGDGGGGGAFGGLGGVGAEAAGRRSTTAVRASNDARGSGVE